MKSSEIIIKKLKETGGKATIKLLSEKKACIRINEKNKFESDKLPGQEVDFTIFDIVTIF